MRDYDEAIAYFTRTLRFSLLEDTAQDGGKRWVRVVPQGSVGTGLLLARAATPEQENHLGHQAGGRVFFLYTDDFGRGYRDMQARGVTFLREPRHETYGTVAVFADLYGNKWDLVQLKSK